MATQIVIPRFLLPLQTSLWRGAAVRGLATTPQHGRGRKQLLALRFASSSSGGGESRPIVLEKPTRFNPPSHGSRLKRKTIPRHYAAELSPEELAAQKQRNYPGLMAPEGTWQHFFWHSRLLHVCITMGTLFSLSIFTFFMNYASNSPFKDLLPPISSLWSHPLEFLAAWKKVIILHEQDKGIKAYEHRLAQQNDVAKRRYYMKVHGIETKDPVTMVFGKGDDGKTVEQVEAEVLGRQVPESFSTKEEPKEEPKKRNKILGIF
ncbi:Conserved hypothetical, protein [Geosmithia morbida]|uniref:Conserved hypothetical, protein n=1 Tax=Geosmithia morbida TaxID=1094350 RepID=A0A9P5D4C2_9HYPO|nr:Conserved hypothetical, protein [Geosmithia morbida]KAF4125897.1 Conserved hypothetical, protein [Geosmithia morbida]